MDDLSVFPLKRRLIAILTKKIYIEKNLNEKSFLNIVWFQRKTFLEVMWGVSMDTIFLKKLAAYIFAYFYT